MFKTKNKLLLLLCLMITIGLSYHFFFKESGPFVGEWVQIKEGIAGQMKRPYRTVELTVSSTEFTFRTPGAVIEKEVDSYVYDSLTQELTFTEKLRCGFVSTSKNPLIVSNKTRVCNQFFRHHNKFFVEQPEEDVLILKYPHNGKMVYFVREKIYKKMKIDLSLQEKHLPSLQDSLNIVQAAFEREQLRQFRIRRNRATYGEDHLALDKHFEKTLKVPFWQIGTVKFFAKAIITEEGKLTALEIDTEKHQTYLDDAKIDLYLKEINKSISLMDAWRPKLNRDSIPEPGRVKFPIFFTKNTASYSQLKSYFDHHLVYPDWHSRWQAPSFDVYLKGAVTAEGDLINIELISNEAGEHFKEKEKIDYYAKEAIRAAKAMGKWKAKRVKYKNVPSKIAFFVRF